MDKRIEKTRKIILNTFMELLKEKGFEKLTIRDISERANINRGTFYLHYIDKYDILEKCIESYVHQLLSHCQNESSIQFHPHALLNIFVYLEKHLDCYQLLLDNDKSGTFRKKLYDAIVQQIEIAVSTIPKDLVPSAEVTTQFLANGFLGVVEWWLNHSMPYSPQEITSQLLSFLQPYIRQLPD